MSQELTSVQVSTSSSLEHLPWSPRPQRNRWPRGQALVLGGELERRAFNPGSQKRQMISVEGLNMRKKTLWSCSGRASHGLSLISITSTVLPGLQRTFCPPDGSCLLASFPHWLEQIIYFKNIKQSFRKRERCYTPSSQGRHLLASPTLRPPQPISYKLAISEPVSVFPLETLDSDFVSCAVATAAVLPCSHLVARTCEAVDVPERESINLTGTRLGTYISC